MVTRGDKLLVAVVVTVALALWPVGAVLAGGADPLVVVDTPDGSYSLPLDVDSTYRFEGSLGAVVVSVEDGAVRVVESACPEGYCVRQGPVSSVGRSIVCIPSGVTVRVGGDDDAGVDAVVR